MAITKIGSSKYRIEIERARAPDGRRSRYYETVAGTKKQATLCRRALRDELAGSTGRVESHSLRVEIRKQSLDEQRLPAGRRNRCPERWSLR